MKIVIHPLIDEVRFLKIREAAGQVPVINCTSIALAIDEIHDASGFIGKITPEMLSNARELIWVQSPTASLEHYIFPELVEHPCQLSNMRGLFYDVIADHVFSYILCVARNLHLYLCQQQKGEWAPIGAEQQSSTLFNSAGMKSRIDERHLHLADCTIGVVGVGSIGAEVCHRAKAFGMNILGVDPIVNSLPEVLPIVWKLDRLPDLLEQSDFVVIAAPHTPETIKLFSEQQFQQMKDSAWLINIGRGVIVDLTDLTSALQSKEIAGAALDVFEEEPLPTEHPLWKMQNAIITPHVAAASPQVSERHLETLLENVRLHASEETPLNIVNKEKWF
ncbi:D-2-hydroxyacid dehydrogenase [Planctomicrobium sp.]|jgi:phosphoglycerate dehydrogenase-like enzyme|nr:D-2-hydroxyacid dehydrogenase [Planctomicrobium sp.]